tara:strand:+ start:1270 stop:1530 length:261 start_codon:yes stop_codon:yes gene_type:complete
MSNEMRVRVYEGVAPPPPSAGPPKKWEHLPLDKISNNGLIEITMEPEEAQKKINAIRNYAGRVAKKTGKKYSVRITDYGIGIWRIE